jgi:hypothetical protein
MPHKDGDERRKYQRDWYKKHIDTERKRLFVSNKRRMSEVREWFSDFKSELYCVECGESHPSCLQFHHMDKKSKEFDISRMVQQGYSIERILSEIEKCVVLCANCHFKIHYNS